MLGSRPVSALMLPAKMWNERRGRRCTEKSEMIGTAILGDRSLVAQLWRVEILGPSMIFAVIPPTFCLTLS